jgi:hypothetical protein
MRLVGSIIRRSHRHRLAASGITKFDELLTREVIVAAAAPASDSFVFANILNNIVGTKLKIVSGYQDRPSTWRSNAAKRPATWASTRR